MYYVPIKSSEIFKNVQSLIQLAYCYNIKWWKDLVSSINNFEIITNEKQSLYHGYLFR